VTHLTDDVLNEYLDAALDPQARRAAERHIGGCEHCRGRLDDLQRLFDALADLPMTVPTADLRPAVLDRIPPQDRRSRARTISAQLGAGLGFLFWLSVAVRSQFPAWITSLDRAAERSFSWPVIDIAAIPGGVLQTPLHLAASLQAALGALQHPVEAISALTRIPQSHFSVPALPFLLHLPASAGGLPLVIALLAIALCALGNIVLLRLDNGAQR
jgi:anti-sigma factor RsiW